MNRFAVLAIAAGLLTASCAGHTGSSTVPQLGTGTHSGRRPMSAPPGWAATGTQPVNLANSVDLGVLSATQSLTVRVGLALHNMSQLQSLVASGQTVDPSTFMSTYAPTSTEVASVTNYLQSQGFTNISVEPNNLIISATGNAAQAQSAFNTSLHAFSIGGTNVWGNVSPAYVPSSLGGIVVAVLGLSNEQMMAPTPHHAPMPQPSPTPSPTPGPPSPCSLYGLEIIGFPTGPQPEPDTQYGCIRNYLPADYWRAYDALKAPVGSNVSVAVMTAGQLGDAVSNLRVNESSDGLAQVPVIIKQVGVQGGVIPNAVDEWTLDMTASSGMARALKSLYVYNTTSLNDADITLMYSHWVTDHLAKIGNSSFGGCEFGPYLDGSMLVDDEIFLQGASQGQTMFASSGDTGAFCPLGVGVNGIPAGVPLVNYPASSPYVMSVGGTTILTQNDGSYQGETAWYAGGGGISQFEYCPTWETLAQPLGKNGQNYRGVPDIALDADLQTGMILYDADQGGWIIIGGTSLASPLAAGSYARLLSNKPSLGFGPPHFYTNFANNKAGSQVTGPPPWQPDGAFHDLLVGANPVYTALPGYDYATGLGSLDVLLASQQM